ncbi:MAG: metallophosphoesterase [Deltaproteobacteria bacterium]|nr:metallophosphoesterase [Deltaproteobacteria bacterium]
MRFLLALSIYVALASCNKLPMWRGEVNVTAMERKSIKACGTGAPTDAGTKAISRHPYLQSTTVSTTIVAWGSTEGRGTVVLREPGDPKVLATSPAVYAGDPTRGKARLAAQSGKEIEADDIYVMKAEFTKLEPGHLYCYQLLDGDVALTELAPLTTAAPPGAPNAMRFVALGDTGSGDPAQIAIMKRLAAEQFDLMLFLGDIAYESGTARQLETRFFAIYRDFTRYVPVYPAIGNHERRTRKGRPYFEAFVLPEPERYYSFDWGDVHFVAIDTTERNAQQLAWLDDDLGKNKLPWVIVYGHHPMYTNSLRGPQLWIRKAFAKILTRHKVDLVLTGHEHQYERFKVGDVNYIVSGGGGGQLTSFYGRSKALKQATVHHYLAFEVSAEQLVMKAIDISGNEIEALKLTKEGGGPVKSKVNDKPDDKSTPVAPEKTTTPDEKLHDEPDDDTEHDKVKDAPKVDAPPAKVDAPPKKPGG